MPPRDAHDRSDAGKKPKRKVVVKKKAPPIPVPSMDAAWQQRPIPAKPKSQKPKQQSVVFRKPPKGSGTKHLPIQSEYLRPDWFFEQNVLGELSKDKQRAVNRYNQDRERERREQARKERQRRQGLERVLKRGAGPDEFKRHLGKNQSVEDFIKHGKRNHAGLGDYARAIGEGLGGDALEYLLGLAHAGQARSDAPSTFDLQRVASNRGVQLGGATSQLAIDWYTDPNTRRMVQDRLGFGGSRQGYDPRWAAAGLGFGAAGIFGGPADELAEGIAKGARYLDDIEGAAVDSRRLIDEAANSLRGRKVWSAQRGEWIETAEPVARSRTMRAAERAAERARKAGAGRLPVIRTGDEKIVEEGMRSIGQTSTVLRSWRGKKIMRLGRKIRFDKPQHYALRIIANGRSPEHQVRYHTQLAEQFAARGEAQEALNHANHAAFFDAAAKYVEQGEDGKWYIRADAPKNLRKIEELWAPSQRMREETYLALGLLDSDQIFRRLHMPSWEIDRELSGLRTSAGRARTEAAIRKMFPDDPKAVEGHMALTDARALAAKRKVLNGIDDRIKALRHEIGDGEASPQQAAELEQLLAAKNDPELLGDWYENLEAVQKGIDPKARELYRQTRGRDFDFATSGMSEEEFFEQPWAQRMPILFDPKEANDPLGGSGIIVGNPGDQHADLIDPYDSRPQWQYFQETEQHAVRLENGEIVRDEWLPPAMYDAAQKKLDEFKARRWGSEEAFDFARVADDEGDWPNEITSEIFARGLPLPPELAGKADFDAAVNRVFDLAVRNADKRNWYKRAAQGAIQISERHPGGPFLPNGVTPDQAAQIIAIMSQASDTVANVTLARRAIDQYAHYGEVFAGRFPQRQSAEVEAVLQGIPWEGRKRNSFYNNIIEDVLGPEEYAARVASGDLVHKPVTVDRWVVRMFRPDADTDTPDGFYDAFEQTLQLMARKLGWDPKEVQAAAWVSIKDDELAKELAERGRGNVRHLAGAGDAYEYGIAKNFPEESQGSLFDVAPTHPRALRIKNDARKPDGGGSYDVDLNPVTIDSGYTAAHGAYEIRVPAGKFQGHHIEQYRDAHAPLLKRQKTAVLGTWHNPEDSVVYLDVSKHFKGKAAAMAFARRQGQLAIWDAKAGKSIPTGLSVDEANAIKRQLRGEAGPRVPLIPADLAKRSLDHEPPEPVRAWNALLEKTARDLGWVDEGKKMKAKDWEYAEEYLWNLVENSAPDDELAARVRDMSYAAHKAQQEATEAAMDFARREEPLLGMPTEVTIPGQGKVTVGPDPELRDLARRHMSWAGLPYNEAHTYRKVNPLEAAEFARAYDEMLDWNDPNAPQGYKEAVQKAYDAFADETQAQYDSLVRAGYEFEFMPVGRDPYEASPRLAIQDLTQNKHMYVFPTDEGFGEDMTAVNEHPLLELTGIMWRQEQPDGSVVEKPVTFNDLFRGVHDAFGHGKEGVGFRADGEDNAFLSHSAMYSDEARKAMASETRGQNSWVNYGPHGEANRTARTEDTVFAEQKAGILPDWVINKGTANEAPTSRMSGPVKNHGLHWVDPEGKSRININEESDAPHAVLVHELAHYDQIVAGLPEDAIEVLRKAGMHPPEGIPLKSSAAKEYKEKFAWAKVNWLMEVTARGDEADIPESVKPVFAAMSDRVRAEMKAARLLDHEDNPGPLSDELQSLFDDLHSWEEVLGARFYLADKRGLATNWRKPMRQINQYMQQARVSVSPGTRSAVTVAGRDISTTTKYRALAMRSGYFKGNATDAIGEAAVKAARLAGFAEAHTELQRIATKTPQNMDDVPMRVDPEIFEPGYAKRYQEQGKEVRKALDLMADMESGAKKVSFRELHDVSMPEIQSLMDTYFPDRVDADETLTETMARLINQQDEIENIVWIPREALEASGIFNVPGTASLQKLAWSAEQAGVAVDLVNNYIKLTMLQLNPAYYFMNFAGNTTMNLMQQGVFYVPNMMLASKLSAAIGEEHATMIDELVGAGALSIAEMTIRGEGGNALPNALNNLATVIVDRIPRRASWLHEARRVGFNDEKKIIALLRAADDGDKAATRVVDHITRRAKDAIVDYDRLTPFEKKYIQRVIFFYPWIKGATRWTARYPMEHPVQAMAFAALFAYQQWSANNELGPRPWYADLMIPLSIPGVGGLTDEEGNPYVLNPKQLLTMTTPYELGRSLAGVAGVAGGQPLVESLTPVLGAGVTMLSGRRSFDDQEVPQDVGTFFSELDPRQLPIRKKIEGIINPPEDDSNYLYPRSQLDRWASLFMGSLAPTPYRVSKGQHLAAGKRGRTPEVKQSEWAEDYEEVYGQQVPPELQNALDAKTRWEKGDQGAKDEDTNDDGRGDLVSADRVLKKLDLLLIGKPEYDTPELRANIERDVEDPESRRLIDRWLEKELGWNDLDYVRGKVNEARRNG